jgi:hypothetical protein
MGDVFARQSTEVFSHRIDVPSESVAARLANALDHINDTASSWYNGTVDSVDRRMSVVRQAMTLARQAASNNEDITLSSLSAREIEGSLGCLYQALGEAHDELSLTEMDLPRFSINSA